MYIVAIGWMFVVVCMAAAEAATGALLGALGTILFYGLLPLGLFLWLVGTPRRKRDRARVMARKGPASRDDHDDDARP